MQDFVDFFTGLFSTDRWPPRWKCGYWSDFHGWLYIISDLLIWAAYFAIPLIIINYVTKRKSALKFNKAYIYFAGFILLCSSTHFLDAVMFWHPMYRLNALVRLITALVSLATVYHLIKILPQAFSQKTNLELEAEILRRKEAESKLVELTLQLQSKTIALTKSNEELEKFAAVASHDLKEPLRMVSGFMDLLNKKYSDKLDDTARKYIFYAKDGAVRMSALISELLAYAQLGFNKGEFEKVGIGEVINEIVALNKAAIEEKNAVILFNGLPDIVASRILIKLLFQNLINNALNYQKKDVSPVIKIICINEDLHWKFAVEDNGIGINNEYFTQIFELFRRIHAKEEFRGTGMGLATCKRIVEQHNGEIWLESEEGKGSTFYFTIKKQ